MATKSHVIKRSIVVAGHKTSVSLEEDFWQVLKTAASMQGRSISEVVSEIDDQRSDEANLSSAIRLFALRHAMQRQA